MGADAIFDRNLYRRRRQKALETQDLDNFLLKEAAARTAERLWGVKRTFASVLDLGFHQGETYDAINKLEDSRLAPEALYVGGDLGFAGCQAAAACSLNAVQLDEEFLPFGPRTFDLVLSNLNLQWVNDLPGTLLQIRHTLRESGLFMASLVGGESLKELRQALGQAELEVTGGLSPRLSPFIDARDLSQLMLRAGFDMPVVDQERIHVIYGNMFGLLRDLKRFGAANVNVKRTRKFGERCLFIRAAELYQDRFAVEGDAIEATVDILYVTAWVR